VTHALRGRKECILQLLLQNQTGESLTGLVQPAHIQAAVHTQQHRMLQQLMANHRFDHQDRLVTPQAIDGATAASSVALLRALLGSQSPPRRNELILDRHIHCERAKGGADRTFLDYLLAQLSDERQSAFSDTDPQYRDDSPAAPNTSGQWTYNAETSLDSLCKLPAPLVHVLFDRKLPVPNQCVFMSDIRPESESGSPPRRPVTVREVLMTDATFPSPDPRAVLFLHTLDATRAVLAHIQTNTYGIRNPQFDYTCLFEKYAGIGIRDPACLELADWNKAGVALWSGLGIV
jgi:hypothetical protein